MDAGGLGMQLAEETRIQYGESVQGIQLSEAWYRENMGTWKAAFEDGLITVPQDEEIIGDIRAVKLVRGIGRVPAATKAMDGQRRHGDAAIASALAYAASRAEPEEYAYQGAAPGRGATRGDPREDAWMYPNGDDEALPPRSLLPELRGAGAVR
jgi:phage FluMu gp28-like protein